jgi:hypothetical protein
LKSTGLFSLEGPGLIFSKTKDQMAYNEKLAEKVRAALSGIAMFRKRKCLAASLLWSDPFKIMETKYCLGNVSVWFVSVGLGSLA